MRQLTGFSIRAEDDAFVLSLTDDSGHVEEFSAAPEQVDAVVDALDELLADYVEDDDDDILVPNLPRPVDQSAD